ncbi:MAG TPA: phosphotransferase family protein [Geminicoccaceae bacterium]|nr:phosphotransferase family protein [Geminicoccus sp.]HMU50708.1 phosphotransferase family protein [Geminicoccaceae bacterium]
MALNTERLAAWIAAWAGADVAAIDRIEVLSGGAIQENWALDLTLADGPRAGRHALVLRTSAVSGVAVSWDRLQEFAILTTAHAAGVTVPEPWVACADAVVIGRPFYLMKRLRGEARGNRLVRDPLVLAGSDGLASRLGGELAKLHRIAPPVPGLDFMPVPDGSPAAGRIAEYRRHLDALDAAEPVLEWALSWLDQRAPAASRVCLLHGDFRTGNYLVDKGELAGILDWEFAAFGDPLEDLGWMLARCWRFGAHGREAGGIGSRQALLAGYEAEAGQPVEAALVPYWEVMATVRWAVIALQQAERHHSGAEPSLELALTGQLLPQLELDLLTRIAEIEAGR